MLTPDQISELHRLHWVEKWSLRKIARHLHIGRRTLAKYLNAPSPSPARRERAQKIEPWKGAIADLLEKDPEATAPVIAQHLKLLGFDGGLTIIKGLPANAAQELRDPSRLCSRRAWPRRT